MLSPRVVGKVRSPRSRCAGSAHRSIGPDVSRGSEPLSIPATWRSKPGLAPQGPLRRPNLASTTILPLQCHDCRKVSVRLEIHLLRLSLAGNFHPSNVASKPTRPWSKPLIRFCIRAPQESWGFSGSLPRCCGACRSLAVHAWVLAKRHNSCAFLAVARMDLPSPLASINQHPIICSSGNSNGSPRTDLARHVPG